MTPADVIRLISQGFESSDPAAISRHIADILGLEELHDAVDGASHAESPAAAFALISEAVSKIEPDRLERALGLLHGLLDDEEHSLSAHLPASSRRDR